MIPSEPLDELSNRQIQMLALDNWLQTPAGQYFVAREQAWINTVVPDLFGFRAVQLGTRLVDGLKENRIPHKAYVQELQLTQALDNVGRHRPQPCIPMARFWSGKGGVGGFAILLPAAVGGLRHGGWWKKKQKENL